tara:strand:- start:346 stop:714 length:369 start_codon:yes stop_codon:yes gene_type:complete
MLSVLSDKLREGSLLFVDELTLQDGKTKEMANVLRSVGIEGSCLIVDENSNEKVIKGSRNIPKVKTLPANLINALDLINKKNVLLTVPAARKIEELWSGAYRGSTIDNGNSHVDGDTQGDTE